MTLLGLLVFSLLLAAAAVSDLARYRIPNWLTATLAMAGLAFVLPQGANAWLSHGVSFAILGGAALALYLVGAFGGGDVKLLAAAGLWMPAPSLPVFVFALALAGGLQALAMLAMRRVSAPAPIVRPAARMPYALSVAAAGLVWAAVQLAAR
ncbi:MAG: prepilin peptidase [Phenylobacterium sp.]|nr:MAG: prepilin peptidase [Phenylobacterium sp.]